jgi:hypothetical protein
MGDVLPDGIYSWRLAFIPDAAMARELRAAAAQNGGEAPNAWLPQSGSFAIQDGSIVSPDVVEPHSRREVGLSVAGSAPSAAESRTRRDRPSEDSDAIVHSGMCEAEVMAASSSLEKAEFDVRRAGLPTGQRMSYGDSDSEIGALGLVDAEFVPLDVSAKATTAPSQESFDVEGANGRARSDDD